MELNTNNENLEKALSDLAEKKEAPADENKTQISKDEEIGFHKGSLNTLVAERNELIKMIANVEAIMQAHIKKLEELGIKIPIQKQE